MSKRTENKFEVENLYFRIGNLSYFSLINAFIYIERMVVKKKIVSSLKKT